MEAVSPDATEVRPGDRVWCLLGPQRSGSDVRIMPASVLIPASGGGGGAQGRIRTTDTRIFSPLLYQLSYLGMAVLAGWEPVRHPRPANGREDIAESRKPCNRPSTGFDLILTGDFSMLRAKRPGRAGLPRRVS